MRTDKEYRERLYAYKQNAYMKGQRIGRDHPQLEPAVNLIAESYRLAMDPEHADLFTATSHLTGKKVNIFTHPPRSTEELLKKQKALVIFPEGTRSKTRTLAKAHAGLGMIALPYHNFCSPPPSNPERQLRGLHIVALKAVF